MFAKQIDFLSIGDITSDAFIRLKEAHLHCNLKHEDQEICFPFGSKIPFEYVKVVKAVGNAANAAVCSARLGLRSMLVSNIGNDQSGKDCIVELRNNKVDTTLVTTHRGQATNYHFVLWYHKDRTILVNHIDYDYHLPHLPNAKWIYLTSIATDSRQYYSHILDYLENNPHTKLAFQPGTMQIRMGQDRLKEIYRSTDVFICNLEEAQKILSLNVHEVKRLLLGIFELGAKLVLITDSTRGAYMYDGDHYYHMPMYPDPRPAVERTGCGDAFSATFVSALALGYSPLEALLWAPVNSMSVAQYIGAQEGLLTREQLEWWLKRADERYKPREIE